MCGQPSGTWNVWPEPNSARHQFTRRSGRRVCGDQRSISEERESDDRTRLHVYFLKHPRFGDALYRRRYHALGAPGRVNVKKDYSFTPPVSVLLPNYNEGPAVYETIRSIMSSEYAGFLEVIAIDDGSVDDSVLWLEKAAQGFPNVQVHKNEKNMGKNKTVLRALGFSQGEIILCIDSDTVFAKNTIAELAACYSEPTLGAVGGVVRVLNADKNVITRFQATQYYLSFELGSPARTGLARSAV